MLKFILLTLVTTYLQDPQPIRKANKITVHNAKSAQDNFIFTKQLLSDAGIEVANQDKDIYQIKTGVVPMKGWGGNELHYLFICRDSSVVVRGQLKTSLIINFGGQRSGDNVMETISFQGAKGSIYRNAWDKLHGFAMSFQGDSLSYEVIK